MEQSDSGFDSFFEKSKESKKRPTSPEGSEYSDYAPESSEERLDSNQLSNLEEEIKKFLPDLLISCAIYFSEQNEKKLAILKKNTPELCKRKIQFVERSSARSPVFKSKTEAKSIQISTKEIIPRYTTWSSRATLQKPNARNPLNIGKEIQRYLLIQSMIKMEIDSKLIQISISSASIPFNSKSNSSFYSQILPPSLLLKKMNSVIWILASQLEELNISLHYHKVSIKQKDNIYNISSSSSSSKKDSLSSLSQGKWMKWKLSHSFAKLQLHSQELTTPTLRNFNDLSRAQKEKFCRRCYIYDCKLHSTEDFSYYLNCPRVKLVNQDSLSILLSYAPKHSPSSFSAREFTNEEKWIIDKLVSIFIHSQFSTPSDISNVSKAISSLLPNIHHKELQEYLTPRLRSLLSSKEAKINQQKEAERRDQMAILFKKKKKKKKKDKSTSEKESPTYIPCSSHEGVCDDLNEACSCDRLEYCDKYCECSDSCKKRFKGCNCEGNCDSNSCECMSAYRGKVTNTSRECDPDICKCKESLCKNRFLQQKKKKRLHIGVSSLGIEVGWGLFAGEYIRKDETLCEYTGELIYISEEGTRKDTYFFSVTEDMTVDSMFIGNKLKYVNAQRERINCVSHIKYSLGNFRIVLVAKTLIKPGAEIFFDYGYDEYLENRIAKKIVDK